MDKLINDKTGNFKAKFKTEFYESRHNALGAKNINWINENMELDKEKYDKYFKEWKAPDQIFVGLEEKHNVAVLNS